MVGFLADAHIYCNHVDGLKEQLQRDVKPLPKLVTNKFTSIYNWEYTDSIVENYEHYPRIHFEIAV
ncbi:MAG: thymidylate synthase [Candidatus Margulisbacteria bacterium]|nr:thymidylate synthase [Candidatus Margulisiibacteriota bacterium]